MLPWTHLHDFYEVTLHTSFSVELRKKAFKVGLNQVRLVPCCRVQSRQCKPLHCLLIYSVPASTDIKSADQVLVNHQRQEFYDEWCQKFVVGLVGISESITQRRYNCCSYCGRGIVQALLMQLIKTSVSSTLLITYL